ncbi:hypothetical protein BGZ83_005432 [Gryganskiella cystojenkinii]|nr:hypothetical protein BGZ83_005432 [Gryganskiella cystojenkinii]
MSKSRISSVAVSPSASASASSHDPHSLPPNFKGLVQRYLAVSLPTVTFTPELIDALDKAEIVIPPRIKVTMRWWKEDASSSLSVYPNLNSSLPPAIEAHQRLLRQQQQQQGPAHLDQMHQNPVQTHSPNDKACQAQVKNQTETRSPTRSAATAAASFAPSFLKKPWAGARFLNAFRMGRGKDKKGKEKNKASLVSSVTEHAHVSQEQSPDATVGKPLPMLPPAAFPLTVAYPVRCSLDQLHRYFQELSLLTLEIHVTPDLVASTAVPNLIDLFHNINGTFSGIFPFSRILKNNAANLVYGTFFRPDVVLGMVVFQAWSQDTSEVSETSEESESASLASTSHQQSYHGPSQDPRLLNFHPRPHSQPAPLPRRLDLDAAHQCGSGPGMLQQSHWTTLAHGSVESAPLHQSSLCFENKHSAVPPAKRGRDFSRSHVSYVDSPAPLISPVDRFHVSDQPTKLQDRNNARNSFHKVTIPVPEVDPSEERHNPHKRYGIAQSSLSESMPYRDRRRSQDTTRTNVTSQGSRSRPRSGATAAAIGRLDAVLARGQDLLQGMKTSLALDPTEQSICHAGTTLQPSRSETNANWIAIATRLDTKASSV